MDKSTSFNEPDLPLEISGYEINTAQDVFVLTRALNVKLELLLETNGYVQRKNIVLTDGQIVDGWVKV